MSGRTGPAGHTGPRNPAEGREARYALSDWAAGFDPRAGDGALPPHHAECLGCGPGNPHGHHLQVRRRGDGVVGEHVLDQRHVGAPGIAHGGAVATVVDDLFGFVLYVVGEPAVTRQLEVEYHAPVWLDTTYRLAAHLDRREGRKLFMRATVTDGTGVQVVSARALFIVVPLEHFAGGAGTEGPPVAP